SFLCSCSDKKGKHIASFKIYTSFYPVYEITKYVVGDKAEVSLLMNSTDVHSYEPSSKDMAELYSSKVFIYHSESFETWVDPLKKNFKEEKVHLIEGVEKNKLNKVKGLEEFDSSKNIYDPHTWLDPILVGEEAITIGKKLSEIDKQNKSYYLEKSEQFNKKMKMIEKKYQTIFKKKKQKYFVTQHTAFSYLAKRFGLQQLGIAGISNELEPNSRQMAEIELFIKENNVKVIFTETNSSPKIANSLRDSTGVSLKVLSPLENKPNNNKTFIENFEENLSTLDKNMQ
ncbi:metal ABC transporter solute-binding protein, Zn/Mn family, partial [Enterococcus faecalis]